MRKTAIGSLIACAVAITALYAPSLAPARRAAVRDVAAVKAFDTTATVADPAWFEGMYARGFRLYVLHSTRWGTCVPWEHAADQIEMALDAGLKVAVYTRDPRCWRSGIEATRPYVKQLQFFALDIEDDPGVPVSQAMIDGVAAMGVRPVIYSGSQMWPRVMGSRTARFGAVPLWDTDVRRPPSSTGWRPRLVSPPPVPYGGWNSSTTMRKGVQQAFEVSVDGIRVDLDSFDAGFLR
jgi:hypothetical protein